MCVCESVCCPPPIRNEASGPPFARNPGGRTLPSASLGETSGESFRTRCPARGSTTHLPSPSVVVAAVCAKSRQSTTRPSEGPCCSPLSGKGLGRGWW